MSKLKMDVLRAKHGDCFFLHGGGATVLIDGGPSGVYRRFLKPYIQEMEGESESKPPGVDLLMISHIDSDHIAGILDLTSELIDAEEEASKPILRINEAWHNSFADVVADDLSSRANVRNASMAVASVAESDFELADLMADSSFVLASVGQGRRLRQDVGRLSISLNRGFPGKLIVADDSAVPRTIRGMKLTVVGPSQDSVDDLREKWAKELPKLLDKEKDRAAAVAAAKELDVSITNLSSLVVIAEIGGVKALLTGDARGDVILNQLTKLGVSRKFDIVKLPHHGSDRNVTMEFFEEVKADHYVVSGNGKHGNPEPAVFEMLFTARPELDFQIHMTYGPSDLSNRDEFNTDKMQQVLNHSAARRETLVFPDASENTLTVEL